LRFLYVANTADLTTAATHCRLAVNSRLLFLSSIFKTAAAQKLWGGFCWNLQSLHRKDDN